MHVTYLKDAFDSVQSVQFIARLKCALVEDARDLQVVELASLLGDRPEVVEEVGQVEVHDFFLEVIMCPYVSDFRHWRRG